MSSLRSSLVALLAGVLIVPTTGATLAASAEPPPAAELTASIAEPKTVRGTAAPTPQFSIAVLERDPARLGGSGAVDVTLTRRGASDRVVRDVQVRISTPAGATISKASSAEWMCSKPKVGTRVVTCTHRGQVARGVTPAPIRVHIDFALNARDRSPITEITARATWKGDPAASSSPWPKPWLVQDVGPIPVDAALGASLSSPAGRSMAIITSGAATARQVLLKGAIAGIGNQQVDAQWFVKSGPKPRFLTPTQIRGAQAELNQVLEYPNTLKGVATSVIGLRVTSDGRTLTRTIKLTLNASEQIGNADGRDKRFTQLAAASRIPVPFEDYVDADDNQITIEPRQQPRPAGSSLTLSVVSRTNVPVASVAWYVVDEANNSTFVTDTRSATFTVPAQPGDSVVVEVAALMANGETQEEGYILYALEDEPIAVRQEATEDDTTANLAVFCSIATNVLEQRGRGTEDPITIDPPGGVKLTFTPKQADISKVFTDGGKCTGAGAMTIAGGTLDHPSAWTFKDVQASVDPTGLTVTRMGWVPGVPVLTTLFKWAGGSGDLITWSGTVTSTLTDGNWGLLGGSATMAPYVNRLGQQVYGPEFLPLPGGWSIPKESTKLLFVNLGDSAPADNTLRLTQAVTGPKDGKGTFTADAVAGSLDNVEVALSNVTLGDNGEGDSLVASGSGRFSLNAETAQRKITLKVECYKDKVLSPDCELVDRLMLKSFTVTLAESITLDAQASFRYADDQVFAFAVSGEYKDSKNWSLAGTTADPWNLGQGLTLKSLQASIERKPRGEAQPDKTDLFVNVEGTLEGITFGPTVQVNSLSARVTNQCAAEETGCTPTEMRLQVDADIKALLPGSSTPTPFNVRAAANLSRLTFTFVGTAKDVAIGPEGMQVTKARFILTNDSSVNTCRPKDAPAPVEGTYTASVGGEVVLLGSAFTVNAQFNGDGYCLWGNSGGLDLGAPGLRAKTGTLAYTNYKGGAVLVSGSASPAVAVSAAETSTIEVSSGRIQLSGDFELPPSVRDYLGASGEVTYKANVGTDLKSADFALTLQMKDDLVLYEQSQASPGTSIRSQVTMSSVQLKVGYDVRDTSAYLKLTAAGKVIVPSQADPTQASITPVAIDGTFELSAQGIKLEISAGVDASQGPVQNAFGQQGLVIRRLAVSLGFALPVPSAKAALNADVTLPATWGSSIGIQPGAPIKLAVSLDTAAPCLVIQIGEEEIAKRQQALDLANLGVITAKFFKLVLAPVGCSLPNPGGAPDKIGKGYAFVFDGEIVGSPVKLGFEVGLGDGLQIKAVLDLPNAIDLYAVKLSNFDRTRGPKLDLDIDTKASKYDIDIDAFIEVGSVKYGAGIAVGIKGSLKTSDKNFITAKFTGHAQGRLGPLNLEIPEKRANGKTGLEVDLKIAKSGAAKDSDKQNFVKAGAELRIGMVGLNVAFEADLNYSDGQLVELKAVVDTTINIVVASLRARVQFDLCQGTLSPIKQDNTGSQCTRFSNLSGASPSIRVGLTGRYRILWWSKDYLWQAYNSEGKEGAAPTPSPAQPLDLSTEIPEGVGNPQLSSAYVIKNHDVRYSAPNRPRFYVKTTRGVASGDVPACDTARVGAQAWAPTVDDTNPELSPQNVYPMQEGEVCGLEVLIPLQGEDANATSYVAKCYATYCEVTTGGFLGRLVPRDSVQGDGATQARLGRDQALTGLTAPPGFMPSGGILEKDGTSPAVIAGWDGKSELRAEAFSLKLFNERGQSVWSFGTKSSDTAISSHFELRGSGKLSRLMQFTQERPGVYSLSREIAVKAAGGVSVKPMLVVSDGLFTVYDGSIGKDTVLWGVKKDGSCFYNKERVGTQDANFCKK